MNNLVTLTPSRVASPKKVCSSAHFQSLISFPRTASWSIPRIPAMVISSGLSGVTFSTLIQSPAIEDLLRRDRRQPGGQHVAYLSRHDAPGLPTLQHGQPDTPVGPGAIVHDLVAVGAMCGYRKKHFWRAC